MRELTKNVRMATWSDELIANKDNQRREGCQGSVQSFDRIDYRNPTGLFSAYIFGGGKGKHDIVSNML